MSRPRKWSKLTYEQALDWLIEEDDTDWLDVEHPIISTTASFCADVYGVSHEKIIKDLWELQESYHA